MRILKQVEQWPFRVAMPWYHGSPHDLPEGTRLVPGGGDSEWGKEFYENHDDRRNHVWLTKDPDLAHGWGSANMTEGEPSVYEVDPESEPRFFDENAPWEGYVAPSATIKRKMPRGTSGRY